MVDPAKLWAGTLAVYGDAKAREIYGRIAPIDAARIVETPDDSFVRLGARELRFLDTPGHARHHVAVRDSTSGHIFTGDVFGLSYRELDTGAVPFVIPTSSPTQFDPEAAHRSVDRIAGLNPAAVYLTHYSRVEDIPRLADSLHRTIDEYVRVAETCRTLPSKRVRMIREGLDEVILAEAHRQGVGHSDDRILEVLDLDLGLNAQGLEDWLVASSRSG